MRKIKFFSFIQALLFLGGCANPMLTAPVKPQVSSQQAATTPVPAPAGAPPASAPYNLTGTAQILGQPMAGASVSVCELGSTTPLVTGTAGADGSFALTVPSMQPGTVYRVVAVNGSQHLVSLYQPSAKAAGYHVTSVESVLLTLATTVAYELLAPRLEASGKLQKGDVAVARAAFNAFNALASGESNLVTKPGAEENDVLNGVDDKGMLKLQSDTLVALGAQASPLELQAFQSAASELGQMLAAAVQSGANVDLSGLGALIFGSTQTISVVSSGSGGGTSGTGINANVNVVGPGNGTFMAPTGAGTAAIQYAAGTVLGTYTVGSQPYDLAVDKTNGHVWVGNFASSNMTELSSTGSVLGTVTVGSQPQGVAVDGTGNVWVTDQMASTVTELSSTGSVLGTHSVGSNPWGVALDGSSGNTWVVNNFSNSVTELSSTGSALGTFTVGSTPEGVAVDGSGNVWVVNDYAANVTELSSTGSVLGTYPVGLSPQDVAVDKASGHVWVSNYATQSVTELSSTGSVLGNFGLGGNLRELAVDGKGDVWVASQTTNSVVELSSTGSVLGTFAVGSTPMGVAVDGSGHVWVTNNGSNSVTELAD